MQKRYGILTVVSVTFLGVMTLVRVLLILSTPPGSGVTLPLTGRVMATGLLFDAATLSYALIPVALYLLVMPRSVTTSRLHGWVITFLYTLFVGVLLFDAAAEYLFFQEFGTRFNFIAVDYLIYTREVIGNIRESYPIPWILSGIGVGAVVITILIRKRLSGAVTATFQQHQRRTGVLLLVPPLLAFLLVDIDRSTIRGNSYATELAGNGIYNLVVAFRTNELDFRKFYRTLPEERVLSRLRGLIAEPNNRFPDPAAHPFTRRITAVHPEKRLNLIVVVEESLSSEYLGVFGNRDRLTPTLDRLSRESLFFTNLYATGTRTVRGLEALSLSIPPLPGTSIVKRPDNGGFNSWGEILRAKGYDTKYIYAGYGYFDNMNAFFSANGFDIVDRTSFARDEITFANVWGVCDEDLFRKTIREARKSFDAGRPFFSMVMTTSNHRPFTYPSGRIDIPSKSGRKGGVKYADYAIGRLIDEARKEPWFRDTLFVIVADHCAGSAGKTDIPIKGYEIPMIVYSPAHLTPARVDTMMSQIDVAPTVLGLLGMSYDSTFFGRDIFRNPAAPPRAFISTYQKLGYLTDRELVVLGPKKYVARYRADRATGELSPLPVDDGAILDALAWFQGGEYVYRNRLNRIR